ncbi:MAG: Rid family detoxifying hydrolase [Candidatus Gracilibacteria bacterium]|nr:Rid family detoxifying hydrolase [Candidatus Gracilibacteria bacterium]
MVIIFSTRNDANTKKQSDRKTVYSSIKSPQPLGHYSKAFVSGDFIFCSGQVGIDGKTNELIKGGIEEETRQACRNISYILGEYEASLKDVVKVTVYLKNIDDIEKVNDIYKDYFVLKPARSTVEVSALPKNALIEIEVIARVGNI